ncbi:MAG: hypothetical protein HYZ01_06550 [Ignavibacteriales bacterium]|nr:hypothetical protein [Ignavibacteriales bacterium]
MELRTKTFLFIIASFLLGAVGGGYTVKTFFTSPNGGSRGDYQRQFAERLHLDSAQAGKVDSIFDAHRARFSEVKKTYSEILRHKRDTLRLEIRKLLTPEQNGLYDGYIKEQEEREKKRENHK